MQFPATKPERFFWRLTALRIPVLLVCLIAIGATARYIPTLTQDTSSDAFIEPTNPALVFRDKTRDEFGLADPVVVAIVAEREDGVYGTEALSLVQWITESLSSLDNVDPERVTSLATENYIVGTDSGLIVEGFFEDDGEHFTGLSDSSNRGSKIKSALERTPLFQGSLIARDGSATLVVAELIDNTRANHTYEAVMALLDDAPVPEGVKVHVAGEGAVSGFLATYISRDARRLNPMAGVIITLVLILCFMSIRGAVLPTFVILGTVAASFGLMAANGVSFYVITNGLIVNLIGIAVADSIHILSQYYEELTERPEASQRELVTRAMSSMWRPVLLTTVTTVAGFSALAVSAEMPPVRYFGIFGAIGVVAAWVYSMTLLPAAMTLWPRIRVPRPFRKRVDEGEGDWSTRLLTRVGRGVLSAPRVVIGAAVAISIVGAVGATKVVANWSAIESFQESEPLFIADKEINRVMDGTYFLDVYIETENPEDLFNPEHLRRIEALQTYLETLPNVGGSTSIADYVKQLHRAVNEGQESEYRIPDDPLLIAQLFFLYGASSSPTDFEEEVDANYQSALVRASVSEGGYLSNAQLIPAVEEYLATQFNTPGITGTVTGAVNVTFHFIDAIAASHIWSVGLSFLAVLLVAMAVFRSALGGVIAILPIVLSVLLVYAVMGFFGINLGVGTSMFAAIAIGLGIDFAIHSLDRIQTLVRAHGLSDETLMKFYPSTGRALLFNFVALGVGFGVLTTSDVPPLIKFGSLVAVAVSASFVCSLTLVPALIKVIRPKFLQSNSEETTMKTGSAAGASTSVAVMLAVTGVLLFSNDSNAQDLSGQEIAERVSARDDGQHVIRNITFRLTDRKGNTRTEETTNYRKYFDNEKRTIFFYRSPAKLRGTGFLTFDYPDPAVDDDQWLYLPALRKVRRISSSNRGDYFLGTDLTYEDIKKEQKIELADYNFVATGKEMVGTVETIVLEGTPASTKISKELGYSKVVWRVDPTIWMSRISDFYDTNGKHLKTIEVLSIEKIDEIYTALDLVATNHKTGHVTQLTLSDVDYKTPVEDKLFVQARLRRGL